MAQDRKLQKLELTWVGKYDEQQPLEPRILIENPEYSYGEVETGVLPNGKPWKGNMLIHGDNLLALKALEQDYAGCVKCIYIDPPYNTGNAFEHYDDGVEHSIWLSLMRERLVLLRTLLSDDGSIWISIDEKEGHYLKVLCDEIFGRKNFIIQTTIQRGAATGHKAINPTPVQVCDMMLTYAKDKDKWEYHPTYKERDFDKAYSSVIPNIEEHYSEWTFMSLKDFLAEKKIDIDKALRLYANKIIRFAQPDYKAVGKEIRDLIDYSKANPEEICYFHREDRPDLYLINGNRILFYKDKLRLINGRMVTSELVTNLWTDMNYQGIAKEGNVVFTRSKKPEAQVKRVLEMASVEGDLVLDSFLGSGTTTAVAQKMNRKYIGIEMGDHAYSLCYPRMKMVANGTDQTGISKAHNWKGGGGFRFYELAPSLLKEDKFGNLVINKEYNADMLAAAMAKQEGFTYEPSAEHYWKQGYSHESDYIYTTTQFMTVEGLAAIAEQMKEGESLLICCTAFQKECRSAFPNITIKKIPQMLLGRCEFAHDDYSLNIVELPVVEEDEFEEEMEEVVEEAVSSTEETQQELF